MLGLGSPKRPRVEPLESGSGHRVEVGQRALLAMAEAARRAREEANRSSGPSSQKYAVVPPNPEEPSAAPHHSAVVPARHERQGRWLKTSVLSLAAVVLVAAIVLAITLATRGSTVSSPVNVRTVTRPPPRSTDHSSHPAPTAGRSTTSAPSAPPPSIPAGRDAVPVLSSLSPSMGVAGQSLVISGANFISADGVVQARFGGQLAPTDCRVQTSCTVTVPAMTTSPTSVPVTITTDGGTSNALTFIFG
jgi:IPT/TIG domain